MKICRYCGEENPDNKNWCKKCMKPLRDDPAEALPLEEESMRAAEMPEEKVESSSFCTLKATEPDAAPNKKSQFGIYHQTEPKKESGRIHGSMGPKNRDIPEEKRQEKKDNGEEICSGLIGRVGEKKYVKGTDGINLPKKSPRHCIYCGKPIDGDGMICPKCLGRNDRSGISWQAMCWITVAMFAIIYIFVFVFPKQTALQGDFYELNRSTGITLVDQDGNPRSNYTIYVARSSELVLAYLQKGADITAADVISHKYESHMVKEKTPVRLYLLPGVYELAFVGNDGTWPPVVQTVQVHKDKGPQDISIGADEPEDPPVPEDSYPPTENTKPENPDDDTYWMGKCGDDLRWVLKNGVLTISGTGNMYDYELMGADASPWFEHREEIISVKIGDKVTSIGDYAFNNCFNLKSITIPGNIKKIGENAFLFCTSLKNVVIENGVITIGDYAFMECYQLTSIKLPGSVTRIGNGAFWNCYLKTITIPAKVSSIGDHAFETVGDNKLTEIRFTGDAPKFAEKTFTCVDATAYYPANNKTWTSAVLKDYGGNVTWIAEGKTDENEKALAVYRPIAEKYNVSSQEQSYGWYSGILIDLDSDNVQELVLRYLSAPFEDAWWSEHKLSVYDYENGKVVTKLDGVAFGEIGGAGSDAYATILYKSGKPYVMTYKDFGETSPGGSIKPNRVGIMTIYDGKTCKEVGVYRIERENNVMTYKINQKTVSEKEFVNEIEQYQGVDVVRDLYQLIEFPETFVTVTKLLQQMK